MGLKACFSRIFSIEFGGQLLINSSLMKAEFIKIPSAPAFYSKFWKLKILHEYTAESLTSILPNYISYVSNGTINFDLR